MDPLHNLVIMANKVSINLSTHNIHGFNSNSHYLKDRCEKNPDSILCIQEHWLRPAYKNIKSINQIRVVHPDFDGYGVSAMKDVHTANITKGTVVRHLFSTNVSLLTYDR